MVTCKDFGDTVMLSIILPVEEKELGNTAGPVGYSAHDTKSTQMNVVLKTSEFLLFVSDVMAAHHKFQTDRAEKIKQNLDGEETKV
jgi:hypothetical protein